MNLILTLKELWRRRALVALSIVVAAAISVLAVFQVSLSPPSISKQAKVEAEGSIELLVDSARSPIADARRDLSGLTARAGVFARYISGGNVIRQIARANDIPVKRIDVAGASPLPGQVPGVEEGAPQINPYGITIVQQSELPILTILTRAPTVREARGLAAATPAAVSEVVRSIQEQQGTPPTRRVEFRVLGPAQAALVDDTLGKKVAAVLFVVLLAIFIVAILVVPRLVAAWRDTEPDARPTDEPEDEPGPTPEVVHLPAGRGGEPEAGDRDTAWIGQGES